MIMKINIFLSLSLFALMANSTVSQNTNSLPDSILVNSVNTFIDNWHKLAADADVQYFNQMASDGIYIGTDATELWTKDEFYIWAKKYFDQGKAWSFTAISRNVYFSDEKKYAWFNELLNTQMGVCRASGVLKRVNNSWKIEHYHLSVAIPNEKMKEVIKVVEKE